MYIMHVIHFVETSSLALLLPLVLNIKKNTLVVTSITVTTVVQLQLSDKFALLRVNILPASLYAIIQTAPSPTNHAPIASIHKSPVNQRCRDAALARVR